MKDNIAAIKIDFAKLLETTPFASITVAAICEIVGISRRTFYRCFSGIDEIVEALVYDDFVAPVRQLRNIMPLDEIKSATQLVNESTHTSVYEKRNLYAKLLDYRGKYSLAEAIKKATFAFNLEVFGKYLKDSDEVEFSSYLVAASSAMAIDWWLRDHINIPPKQMAKYQTTWLYAHFRELEEDS
jgi:AcrR family transcriptional regulator